MAANNSRPAITPENYDRLWQWTFDKLDQILAGLEECKREMEASATWQRGRDDERRDRKTRRDFLGLQWKSLVAGVSLATAVSGVLRLVGVI